MKVIRRHKGQTTVIEDDKGTRVVVYRGASGGVMESDVRSTLEWTEAIGTLPDEVEETTGWVSRPRNRTSENPRPECRDSKRDDAG